MEQLQLPRTIRFGTSGLRGVTGSEITIPLAYRVGYVYGEWKRLTCGHAPRLTVAQDQRRGAAALAEAAARGMLAAGAESVNALGCVPTGVMCFHTATGGYDGGILITGSHMPPERIGIIPIEGDGRYCEPDTSAALERRYAGSVFDQLPPSRQDPDQLDSHDVTNKYVSALKSALGETGEVINRRKFKILVDTGNGTAGPLAVPIFHDIFKCQVIPLHQEPKEVPNRPSEVRAGTCGKAIQLVRKMKCDLGVCYDGDADRVLFITPEDGALNEDTIGALFASHYLRPGQVCVTPVNSSPLIKMVARERGFGIVSCKIGQPDTGRAVVTSGASYFYEASAKYGWPNIWIGDKPALWYDSLFTTLQMLGLMARRCKTANELVSALPRFERFDRSVEFRGAIDRKRAVIDWAAQLLRDDLGMAVQTVSTLDGTRLDLEGDTMVMVRASGTEEILRAYVDGPASKHDRLVALANRTETALRQAITTTA